MDGRSGVRFFQAFIEGATECVHDANLWWGGRRGGEREEGRESKHRRANENRQEGLPVGEVENPLRLRDGQIKTKGVREEEETAVCGLLSQYSMVQYNIIQYSTI